MPRIMAAAAALAGSASRILRKIIKGSARLWPAVTAAPGCWSCSQGAKRYLLRDNAIGLQQFQEKKLATRRLIYEDKDSYFRNIKEKMEKKELILRNELKILLHLCQTSDDVEIAKSAIYRYHSENRTMAFGDYKFGPIFMRLCYELGLEVPAMELIKDETLYGFFSDGQSFALLMDMLFKKGYYEDAFEVLEEMEKQHVKYIKDTFLLAFAICYKLDPASLSGSSAIITHSKLGIQHLFPEVSAPCRNNSPVSWKKFTKILEENQFQLDTLPRITYCFAVAFALKQNDLEKAQYIYSLIMNPDSRLCTNLKILMQIKSGALEETLKTLEAVLEENTPELVKKTQISEQVLATVREELEENPALLVRLEDIYDQLKASGKVTKLTLDEMLCKIPLYKEYYKKLSTERTVSLRTFKPLQSVLKTE